MSVFLGNSNNPTNNVNIPVNGGIDDNDYNEEWWNIQGNTNDISVAGGPPARKDQFQVQRPRGGPPNLPPRSQTTIPPWNEGTVPHTETVYLPNVRVDRSAYYVPPVGAGLPPRIVADNVSRKTKPKGDDRRRGSDTSSMTSRSDRSGRARGSGHQQRPAIDSDDCSVRIQNRRRHRPVQRSTSSSRSSSRYSHHRNRRLSRRGSRSYGLTSGTYFTPPQRETLTVNWCEGCGRRRCQDPISVKDFDTMQNVIRSMKPEKNFTGAKDARSGTTWVTEMRHETEGHPDVVRYLWLKRYTNGRVWNEMTSGTTAPSRCYRSYERQVRRITKRFQSAFDTDEHLHYTEHKFNNCIQGGGTVYDFIERLEDLSTELYHMGSPVLEYKLKWKLYQGLAAQELRVRVNDYLDDKKVDYAEFKEAVLRQQRRMTAQKSYMATGNDNSTKDYSEQRQSRRREGFSPGTRPWRRDSPMKRSDSVNSIGNGNGYSTDGSGNDKHYVCMGRDLTGFKCYRCLQRGHAAKDCLADEPTKLDKRCRSCGNPNHVTDDCKVNTDKLFCHRCQNPGHLAYACTTRLSKANGSTAKRPSTPRPSSKVHMISSTCSGERLDKRVLLKATTSPTSSNGKTSPTTSMLVGTITIEGQEIPALFDTGAEVSLITRSALRYLSPHAAVDDYIVHNIMVADGTALQVDGTVKLRISTRSIVVDDHFIVTSDDLNVPVLLGCPTLAKLRTTIRIGPHGMHVYTNDSHLPSSKAVRFDDNCMVMPLKDTDDSNDDLRQQDIHFTYKINHIKNIFLRGQPQSAPERLSDDQLLQAVLPDIILHPNIEESTPNDFNGGEGKCNHLENEPLNDLYVYYMATSTSPMVNDPHHKEFPTTIDVTCNNDKEDETLDNNDDNLPPWDALSRTWCHDETTPLGRAYVRIPWGDDSRPPFNFKNAASRGAASIRRLSAQQRQSFEEALNAYVKRGFCKIVKNNDNGPPTFDECQKAWDELTTGTAYDGTPVVKPKHYTPSHTVFRDQHPTTPCRIVLDFRALNKFTRRGGKTQNDLQGVLLLLRGLKYFMSADVSKAFCQMKGSLYDVAYSCYTCIGNYTVLWSSIAFGSNNAPCMLEACTHDVANEIDDLVTLEKTRRLPAMTTETMASTDQQLCEEQLEKVLIRPSAAGFDYINNGPVIPLKVLLLKYVDDLYFGGKTKQEAAAAYNFGTYVFNGHGFHSDPVKSFCSWLLTENDECKKKSTLGYVLRLDEDKFYAVYSGYVPDDNSTKLQACAALASLYDPLGLYVELDLQGRLIWRDICANHKSWDDVIKEDLYRRVKDWTTLCTATTTTVGYHRFIDLENLPLVISADASAEAWGVDVRCFSTTTTTRVTARGGIFPLTQSKWSIPRKELVALHHALTWLKSMSAYLPIRTCLRPHQAPLDRLSPQLPERRGVVLSDSEITVYRLRRPGRDAKLPIVERRRLKEIREMCRQLDVTVKHVPTELNYADSISRAKVSSDNGIDGTLVVKAMTVSNVAYDYTQDVDDCSTPTAGSEDEVGTPSMIYETPDSVAGFTKDFSSVTTSPVANATNDIKGCHQDDAVPTLSASIMTINVDGIDLPNYNSFTSEEKSELFALAQYARPPEEVDERLLQDGSYERCLLQCIRRSQETDEDLNDLKKALKKKTPYSHFGVKANKLRRWSQICYLDADDILRRQPSAEKFRKVDEDKNGVIYLGTGNYSRAVQRLLAVVYHYKYIHLGARRVANLIQRRFYAKRITRVVRSTLRSCTSCTKARATRKYDYIVNKVQDLLTTGLWQIVGIDVAGPYDRPSRTSNDSGDRLDPNKDYYVLLVQDYVSGFTAARPLRNIKTKTVADAVHGVFCEHGSPSVVVSDNDKVTLITKHVKKVLRRHGTKHYTLPGYGQHLSFWERSHKDMVDVVKAIRESRHSTERSNLNDSYINDFLLSVRAYNTTPRGWANVSPSELHYVYKGRLPGDQEGMNDFIDWDSLKLKFTDTDAVEALRETIPNVEALRKEVKVTLNDYMDYWRLKQERLLERYALQRESTYEPKLYDIVFTTKTGDVKVGKHLDSTWKGPSTIVKIRGSGIVDAVPSIVLPGVGGVKKKDDLNELEVPLCYGQAETFALRNVHHTPALQNIIYNYLEKGTRVYSDVDGSVRSMDVDIDNDGKLLREAKALTAYNKTNWPPTDTRDDDVESEQEFRLLRRKKPRSIENTHTDAKDADIFSGNNSGSDGNGVVNDTHDEVQGRDLSSTFANDDVAHTLDNEDDELPVEDVDGLDVPDDAMDQRSEEEDVLAVNHELSHYNVDKLRQVLGSSKRHVFGKFVTSPPPVGTLVITVNDVYHGLARILDYVKEDNDMEKAKLQPMTVCQEGVLVKTSDYHGCGLISSSVDDLIYVRPTANSLTRGRGKELTDLLTKVEQLLSQ
ncbi:hypothetical protein FOL47_005369 [Perkinsus chesapeaki]|uniref:Paraneoplastic Ma antigen n=1 Tax=Perkinsus chesapeaki TaxID=330153 RepID=A0A7J6N3R7_PERCH|nr:hypothetical protein FOL47_005369 [Perkinsus chesapeaki]